MKHLCGIMLCLLLLTGCTAARQTAIQLEDASAPGVLVLYSTKELRAHLDVYGQRLDASGNLYRCAASFKNLSTSFRLPLEYIFEWKDSLGVPQQTSSAWLRLTLGPNQSKTIVSVAKSPEARQVTLYIRTPQDVQILVPAQERPAQ